MSMLLVYTAFFKIQKITIMTTLSVALNGRNILIKVINYGKER